jgi:NAD(P)-dependent dehydrogenase (short-subunit alcohol dehydrogenase family)
MGSGMLAGQVSLVTGAGRGIGRAVALALSDEGSAVVLGARTQTELEQVAAEIQQRGGQAAVVRLDVTDMQSVQAFVAAAMDRFGRIDVLINNAGSNNGGDDGAIGPLWEINPEAWWRDVAINLRGTFLCTHTALPYMVSQGRGHILNVASLSALTAWPYDSAYACAKAAVVRLTDSVAEEVRDHGVYVYVISPGRVQTKLLAGALDTPAGHKWMDSAGKSMGAVGTAQHTEVSLEVVTGAVVYLVSGQADGLTGRFLRASWDLPELAARAEDIAGRDVLQLRFMPD